MDDKQDSQVPLRPSDSTGQTIPPAAPASVPTPTAPKQKEYPPFAPPIPVTEHDVHDKAKADQIAKEEGDEYWEKYAREIELEKEIAEIGGVEKVESGEVKIPKELAEQMGIKVAVTIDTPIANLPSDFSVRGVTLDDTKLSEGGKKPISSAFRWLVEWFILQLKKAHFIVKLIKGKVTRTKVS